jgi:protein gp37
MGANTKIAWAHHTFNPWYGCQKVGPGCDHCYAESWAKHYGAVEWGAGVTRKRSSPANWKKPLAWNADAERKGIRYRVFCASLADVFDNAVPTAWRMDLFSLIANTPNLDWLLLTKRIGNVMKMCQYDGLMFDQLPHVWLGVTVCNQEEADRDIPKLLQLPAGKRFVSIEPMLGSINLTPFVCDYESIPASGGGGKMCPTCQGFGNGLHLDWVIVGGESGAHARPMHPDWVRSLRDQCAAAQTPFLFKQWGEWCPASIHLAKPGCNRYKDYAWSDGKPYEYGDGSRGVPLLYRAGKNVTGRLLDGVLHDGYPEVQHD